MNHDLLHVRHVIGLDIGDGESAIAWVHVDDPGKPMVYQRGKTGERSILTAIARNPEDGLTLFGEEAAIFEGAKDLEVNFKGTDLLEVNVQPVRGW